MSGLWRGRHREFWTLPEAPAAETAVGRKTLESKKASCKSDHVERVVVRVAQMLGPFIQITSSINTSDLVPVVLCSYNTRLRNRFHYAVPEAMARQKGEY